MKKIYNIKEEGVRFLMVSEGRYKLWKQKTRMNALVLHEN